MDGDVGNLGTFDTSKLQCSSRRVYKEGQQLKKKMKMKWFQEHSQRRTCVSGLCYHGNCKVVPTLKPAVQNLAWTITPEEVGGEGGKREIETHPQIVQARKEIGEWYDQWVTRVTSQVRWYVGSPNWNDNLRYILHRSLLCIVHQAAIHRHRDWLRQMGDEAADPSIVIVVLVGSDKIIRSRKLILGANVVIIRSSCIV